MSGLWKHIAAAHRSDDDTESGRVREFLLPRLTKGFFIRLTVVAVIAVCVFRFLLLPCIIDGGSMMPTYKKHGFIFCKLWSYWFSPVKVGDVVIVDYAAKTYLLKRVVALAGDTVEFRRGTLFVNGKPKDEPYVRYASTWNLPPREVKKGFCYVVGDNRAQMMSEHIFGQVPLKRIKGQPL